MLSEIKSITISWSSDLKQGNNRWLEAPASEISDQKKFFFWDFVFYNEYDVGWVLETTLFLKNDILNKENCPDCPKYSLKKNLFLKKKVKIVEFVFFVFIFGFDILKISKLMKVFWQYQKCNLIKFPSNYFPWPVR